MKKPKQKRKRTNVRKKGASTQVNTRSRAANKRKVVNASLNVVAILVVAGAFAYGWLTGNRAPPAEEQPLTETAAAGGSQHVEPAKVQIFEEDRDIGTMLVSAARAAEFVLRHVGGKPLPISAVRSSCLCPFATGHIYDQERPTLQQENGRNTGGKSG